MSHTTTSRSRVSQQGVRAAAEPSRERALDAVRIAIDRHGLDPVLLDVSRSSGYADYLLLVSGRSDRHVETIAEAMAGGLGAVGIGGAVGPLVEGRGTHWVVIDAGDVVVHVFYAETREFYDLEGLWTDAPRVPLDVPPESRSPVETY